MGRGVGHTLERLLPAGWLAWASAGLRYRVHLLLALAAYPFIDFALRTAGLPVLPALWDDALLAALILLWGVAVWQGQRPRPSPVLLPMGVFLAIASGVALTDLPHLDLGLEGLRATFEYMLAFLIALNLVRDAGEIRAILRFAAALAVPASLYGIYQYLTGAPMPESWVSISEDIRTRAYSIVGSPNGLGDYLGLMIPICLGLAYQERGARGRLLWLGAAAVLAAGLLLTFSRGAWLALVLGMGVMAMLLDRRLLALFLAMAILGAFVPPVTKRLAVLASPDYWKAAATYGGRLYRWNQAYQQVNRDPLAGAGVGKFGGAVAARRLGTLYTDNYYAKTLAETGTAGLLAFLWLMWRVGRTGYGHWRRLVGRPEAGLAAGLLGNLLVVIFHNGVENIFEIPFLNAYFWFFAGVLAALPALAASAASDEGEAP